jgi:L,D-transpeptidase-like protein
LIPKIVLLAPFLIIFAAPIAAASPTPALAQSSPVATPTAISSPSPAAATTPGPAATPAPVAAPAKPIDRATGETPGAREFRMTHDASVVDPRNWALMAYKQRHQIIVYYKGRQFKAYHAVFGRSGQPGTKLWAGDRRTPEGLYVIIRKYPSRRFTRFLRLNYPNKIDRNRYDDLREHGAVPTTDDGNPLPEGGAIGIHGTDVQVLNDGDIDWTTGCISVDNDAIVELNRLIPVGTMVLIKP